MAWALPSEEGVGVLSTEETVTITFSLCFSLHPCPSGLLCATGATLQTAHQVNNTTDSLSEHWSEHNAYQLGPSEANGLYHGPTQVLPGKKTLAGTASIILWCLTLVTQKLNN